MDVTGADSDWRSAAFRQKLVSQIDEAMRKAGVAHTKSSKEMESHVFLKAKTREEYLSLVARLIIHFRDIHNKKSQASVSDPMNALQNLTGAAPQAMGMGVRPSGPQMGGMGGIAQMAQQMNLAGQPQPGASGMPSHGITGVPAGSQPTQLQLQQMAQQQQQQQFQQQQAALQQQQFQVAQQQQQQQFQVAAAAAAQQQQQQQQVQQQQQQQQLQAAAQQQHILKLQMQQQQNQQQLQQQQQQQLQRIAHIQQMHLQAQQPIQQQQMQQQQQQQQPSTQQVMQLQQMQQQVAQNQQQLLSTQSQAQSMVPPGQALTGQIPSQVMSVTLTPQQQQQLKILQQVQQARAQQAQQQAAQQQAQQQAAQQQAAQQQAQQQAAQQQAAQQQAQQQAAQQQAQQQAAQQQAAQQQAQQQAAQQQAQQQAAQQQAQQQAAQQQAAQAHLAATGGQMITAPMARGGMPIRPRFPPSTAPATSPSSIPLGGQQIPQVTQSSITIMSSPSPVQQVQTPLSMPPPPQPSPQPSQPMSQPNSNVSSGPAPSPSSFMPSPSPQPSQSPASARTPQNFSVPSPGPLNTPGNPNSVMSPASTNQSEEQQYLDKLKQLSKYIEPLRRMINKIDKNEERKKDLSKMKSLLDILTDPNKRCPLKTLQKCEIALEKLKNDMAVTTPPPPTVPSTKQQYLCQPLLDAVLANIRSPVFNHSLYRTFMPAMTAIHGQPITTQVVASRKRKCEEDERQTIPNVLQGEVAKLHSKFLVNLDPSHCSNNGTVHLICKLDDKNLPSVPPLQLSVPADYPEQSPLWMDNPRQYEANPFLQSVYRYMTSKLLQLPDKHSLTALLNTWAQSIRQACLSAA
ncbi:mediator of RNA polymerase II transcription subunit 15 isoform 2-T2 [Rhinophrynus dorsalis]